MTAATATNLAAQPVTIVDPKALAYSRLYLDFIDGRQPAIEFYSAASPEAVLPSLDNRDFPRDQIVRILMRQNEVSGLSETTRANIERLNDSRAVCVFAGQQAGLFGGPLFTLIKALAIVKLARLHSEKFSRPVVPIFWIAGDDHDFAEANHTFVLSRKGEICRLEYQTAPPQALPAGEIRFDDAPELTRVIDQLEESLGQSDFVPSLLTTLRRCYTPNDTMVTAFGKFMAAIAGETGLVLFNPADHEVKRLAQPFFGQVIEKQSEVSSVVKIASERLRDSGYHAQVEKKENSVHLFCNEGGRTPTMLDGSAFTIGDRRTTRSELDTLLQAHPETFSTDVLTRPLLQSWLFPVLIQMGGPSEIAYFAQVDPLFAVFQLPAPVFRARPTLTLVERRSEQLMQEHRVSFEDLLGDVEQVVNRVLAETFPERIEGRFEDFRKALEDKFNHLNDEVISFDPTLKGMAEQTRGKVDFLLKGLEAKVFAAHKKKGQETRERIYRLNNSLYPQHMLQERCLNITYFLARYGAGIVTYLYEYMNSEETAHQLLSLSSYEP